MTKHMNLLKLENLSVKFKSKKTIKNIFINNELDAVINTSFIIKKNKTFGIVGESGSGKTTIAKTILGLHNSFSGKLKFDDKEIDLSNNYRDKNFRKNVSMIFQDSIGSLSPRIKVKHLIAEPFQIHKINNLNINTEINKLLESVGLSTDFLDRYPHELSGGQAKRISIARAIALKPKLLIADEPTAGLDVSVQGEILNLLRKIQDNHGMSMLIISHNLNHAGLYKGCSEPRAGGDYRPPRNTRTPAPAAVDRTRAGIALRHARAPDSGQCAECVELENGGCVRAGVRGRGAIRCARAAPAG